MKCIAMISDHASPLAALGGTDAGGQNVYVGELARALAARGDRIDIFTRRDAEQTPAVVEWMPGIRVVHVDAGPPTFVPKEQILPYMTGLAHGILAFMEETAQHYDVLHAHFWTSAIAGSRIRAVTRIPLVITFHALGRVRQLHQMEADRFPVSRGAIEERLVLQSDAVLAECPQDAADLRSLYRAEPERLRLVPCGVDGRRFRPLDRVAARQRIEYESADPLLLHVGRMVPRKGVDTVVRAVARLRHRHRIRARLLVVGGESDIADPSRTPYLAALQSVAAEEGVTDSVTFVGRRRPESLVHYYNAGNVFVTTPWYEPFGITPLESMACGTPVVGSAVGGLKYTVLDGVTGYLVPPRDPSAVADRVARLLRDPEGRAEMGRDAIERVRQCFLWHQVARTVDRIYDDVIVRARRTRWPAARPWERPPRRANRPQEWTA